MAETTDSATPDSKETSTTSPATDMLATAGNADAQDKKEATASTANTDTQKQFSKAHDGKVTEKQAKEELADTSKRTAEFKGAASGEKKNTKKPRTPQGFYTENIINKDGKKEEGVKVHHALAQMSMGDAFGKLIFLLSVFLKDPEMFPAWKEHLYPKDTYTDPVERQQRITNLEEVAVNKDHADRKLPIKEFAAKHFSAEHLGNLKAIAPQLNEIVGIILKTESAGGNLNIVWDYRNRTQLGQGPGKKGSWPGLQKGDRTPGGLIVPDAEKSTVKEIIAWQKQYIREQKTAGLTELKQRSSAFGAYQFTYTTLEGMIKNNSKLTSNEAFNAETQALYRDERIKWRIENAIKNSDGTIESLQKELEKEFKSEWEGLQGNGNSKRAKEIREAVKRITGEMAHNIVNDKLHDPQIATNPDSGTPSPQG